MTVAETNAVRAPLASSRGVAGLMAVGCLLAALVVSLGGPMQNADERRLLGGWLRVARAPGDVLATAGSRRLLLVGAVVGLVVVWAAVAVRLHRHPPSGRLVLFGAITWSMPFALGPPFLSRDAYAYLAQGEVLRRGLDPYRHPVSELGRTSHLLLAVDPAWRETVPPYGPLALRLEQVCAWFGVGAEWRGLVALRILVLVSLVLTVWLLRKAVPAAHRALVTWLACSPLVLLQLLGALHLEGVVCLLLVAAAVLHQRGHSCLAVVAAMAASEIKATAGLVVLLLVVRALVRLGWRAAAKLAAVALITGLVSLLLLPQDPLGWVRGLSTPTSGWAPFTPSSTLYLLLSEIGLHLQLPAWPLLKVACRLAGVLLGVSGLVLLARRAKQHSTAWNAAAALLIVVLSGPVLWPWYLAPSALLLLLSSRGLWPAIVLGALPALAALPITTVYAQRVVVAAELVVAAGFVLVQLQRRAAAVGTLRGAVRPQA